MRILAILALSANVVMATRFTLQDDYSGSSFLDGFTWETFDDPTGGRVNYLDQATALARNVTYGKRALQTVHSY